MGCLVWQLTPALALRLVLHQTLICSWRHVMDVMRWCRNANKGMKKEDASKAYVALVTELKKTHN
jgi:hypothetical protein